MPRNTKHYMPTCETTLLTISHDVNILNYTEQHKPYIDT